MIAFFTGTAIGRVVAAIVVALLAYAGFRLWLASHDEQQLNGYVLLSEKTAAESLATEMIRQRNAAALSLEEYRKRAEADERHDEAERQHMEQIIANDTGDGCTWGDDDAAWLCKQGIASACSR